jgi:hypothetical protein
LQQILKLIVCLCIVYSESKSLPHFLKTLSLKVTPFEVLRLAVPSLLYLFQNNLLYYAISNLDAAIFSVVYQV